MARPASTPSPIRRRLSEVSTSYPRPPAPIIEAMITMLSESMMTWLMPTISDGRADGTNTFHRSCRREQPAMRPNSTISAGTWCSASIVTLTIGGVA